MKSLLQYKWVGYLAVIFSAFLIFLLSRYTPRHHFYKLTAFWLILFGLSWIILNHKLFKILHILGIGILFRLLLIDILPWMSQDYFRFIWDGRLLFKGINPYLSTPLQHITNGNLPVNHAQTLYEGMGALNAKHFTNYPPMSQFGYWIAAIFGRHSILLSVISMRILLILADIGTFVFGVKLLKLLQLPTKNIALYFLNPFVILELTGNLHFEALMVFFLVISLYFILQKKWIIGGILLGVSVNVKLLPLLLVPVFARFFLKQPLNSYTSITKLIQNEKGSIVKYLFFVALLLSVNFLLFIPFINSEFITNFSSSIGLWFNSFEFNASLYYIARWVGFQIKGWNMIALTGKLLPAIAILCIFLLSLFRKNEKKEILLSSLLFAFTTYLLFSTTVHPWYLAIPLALSCFTNYRFIWIWSAVVIFSYNTYIDPEYWHENLWWVGLEYLTVGVSLLFFLFTKKRT